MQAYVFGESAAAMDIVFSLEQEYNWEYERTLVNPRPLTAISFSIAGIPFVYVSTTSPFRTSLWSKGPSDRASFNLGLDMAASFSYNGLATLSTGFDSGAHAKFGVEYTCEGTLSLPSQSSIVFPFLLVVRRRESSSLSMSMDGISISISPS